MSQSRVDKWFLKADTSILIEGMLSVLSGADYLNILADADDRAFCCLSLEEIPNPDENSYCVAEGLYINLELDEITLHPETGVPVMAEGMKFFTRITGVGNLQCYFTIINKDKADESIKSNYVYPEQEMPQTCDLWYKGLKYRMPIHTLAHYTQGRSVVKTKSNLEFYGIIQWKGKTYTPGLHSYHGTTRKDKNDALNKKYRIGFEVEKENQERKKTISADYLQDRYGWVAEYDSSLDEGYELVSPIYSMMSRKTIMNDLEALRDYIDGGDEHRYENCGGHINVSIKGETGYDLLRTIKGFAALLYAMYPKRADRGYGRGYKFKDYLEFPSKRAFYPKDDLLEIRIFPGVTDVENLMQRYELVRYMVTQPAKSTITVVERLLDPTTRLHMLITDMGYKPQELAQEMLEQNAKFDKERYTQKIHKCLKDKGLEIKTIMKPTAKETKKLKREFDKMVNSKWFQAITDLNEKTRVLNILKETAAERIY